MGLIRCILAVWFEILASWVQGRKLRFTFDSSTNIREQQLEQDVCRLLEQQHKLQMELLQTRNKNLEQKLLRLIEKIRALELAFQEEHRQHAIAQGMLQAMREENIDLQSKLETIPAIPIADWNLEPPPKRRKKRTNDTDFLD